MYRQVLGIICLYLLSINNGKACICEKNSTLNGSDAAAIYISSAHQFSIDLFKLLYNTSDATDRNVFFSPHSIWTSLTLTYLGAGGATRQQMQEKLRLQELTPADLLRATRYVHFWYQMRSGEQLTKNSFNVASRLYFDNDEGVRDCMKDLLKDEIRTVDFTFESEKVRESINTWVSSRTADRVRNLLPPGIVDSSTRMVLVNAAYFKGTWESQFKPENTKLELFYASREEITFVSMMSQKGQFNFGLSEELQSHVLELPYNGEELSLVIVLPPFVEGALDTTVNQITSQILKRTLDFMWTLEMTVKLPKFRIEESYELSSSLGELGLGDLFDASQANLTGFSRSGSLFLSNAMHKSFLQLDEKGSEAAAATALISSRTSRPVQPSAFICDHPFLYLIYDRALDNILFMGTFEHPKSAKRDLDKDVTGENKL